MNVVNLRFARSKALRVSQERKIPPHDLSTERLRKHKLWGEILRSVKNALERSVKNVIVNSLNELSSLRGREDLSKINSLFKYKDREGFKSTAVRKEY